MNQYIQRTIDDFFRALEPWGAAYVNARLTFVAIRCDNFLEIISARIYLMSSPRDPLKNWFVAGNIEAGQVDFLGEGVEFARIVSKIASPEGFEIAGHGLLILRPRDNENIIVASPDLLHAEGVSNGNRLAVLTLTGIEFQTLVHQPQTDWILKAAVLPYDSLVELRAEYGLGTNSNISTVFEVVAHAAVEVFLSSNVIAGKADLGLWMAGNLDRSKARLGYRVLDKGSVVSRGSIEGCQLDWTELSNGCVGKILLDIPLGAVVHCITSYAGHAHNIQWFADPQTYQNSRAAILASVDQTGKVLRNYLLPELPPKNKAADDFETAVAWVLWALGFSTASFGVNAKTRDSFDILAVSPKGDFLVVECTLGLLRAESKLSKLSARVVALRKVLTTSGLFHLRVLPVIVTAMTLDEVRADLKAAAGTGVLVLTREDLEDILDGEQLRFANADRLFDEAMAKASAAEK